MIDIDFKAPKIDSIIRNFWDNYKSTLYDDETTTIINNIIYAMHKLKPVDNDGEIRSLWVKAETGTLKDFGDYKSLKKEGWYSSKQDFIEDWKVTWPGPYGWFKVSTIENDDVKEICVNNNIIYLTVEHDNNNLTEYGGYYKNFYLWLEEAVQNALKLVTQGTYNKDVSENLPYINRYGTIDRKTYWDIFNIDRELYFKDITEEEIKSFKHYVEDQKGDERVGEYIKEMTAHKFFTLCALGYKENKIENLDGLSLKEQYLKCADRRDGGLTKIDEYSPKAFNDWYEKRNCEHYYEVMKGGHVILSIQYDKEKGYYVNLSGCYIGNSIETIKFYNALRREGIAIYLWNKDVLSGRLFETDRVGILPRYINPLGNCSLCFPNMNVFDGINLPYDKDEYDKIIPHITWIDEPDVSYDDNLDSILTFEMADDVYQKVNEICKKYGITFQESIRRFFQEVVKYKGLPPWFTKEDIDKYKDEKIIVIKDSDDDNQ